MKRWGIRFKDRRLDPSELTLLAKEFYRDLVEEKVTDEEFSIADRQVCKQNRFFPVMADLLTDIKRQREENSHIEAARAKWRRDNEWKKNFPEMLTADQRKELGVPIAAIEAAVDRGDIDRRELLKLVNGLSRKMAVNEYPQRLR